MPKCSICDANYDADYDACPHCAKRAAAAQVHVKTSSNAGAIVVGAVVIAVAIGAAVWFYVASQPPTLGQMLGF